MSYIPMYKLNKRTMPLQTTISKKRRNDDEESVASGAIGMEFIFYYMNIFKFF